MKIAAKLRIAMRGHFRRDSRMMRALLAVAVAPLLLSGCADWVEQAAGPVSGAERTIFFDTLAIMLLIVVPVIIATIGFAWWYRASNERARHLPTWSFSGRIEIVIWSIPALVIFFLGGIAWISAHDLDPAHPIAGRQAPLEIDVVALDWKWLFIYPEQGVASVNRLVVPAGVPLRFRLTSATVWNAFWIPRLGSMLYCMYGMAGTLYLQADEPGVYQGVSAMISGDGFSTMHFDTDALGAVQFAAWTRSARNTGPALDERAYRALLKPSAAVQPYSYGAVKQDLFNDIVMQRLPPGQGSASNP